MKLRRFIFRLFFASLCFIGTSLATAQSNLPQSGVYNLTYNNAEVGQVQRFGYPPGSGSGRWSMPLVYVSGFELSASEIIDGAGGGQTPPHVKLDSLTSENGNWPPFLRWLVASEGFTVYVVQPKNADAAIQTSSLALEAALTDSNFELRQHYYNTGNPSAVLGWSMGGVVARYALAKMESNNVDHGASVYVSIDAPHRGAFLPTSLEVLVRSILDLKNEGSKIDFQGREFSADDIPDSIINIFRSLEAKLDSNAARQLLGVYLKTSNSISSNFIAGSTVNLQNRYNAIGNDGSVAAHPSFYALRNEMLLFGGYPALTKNIGVTHGALDGTKVFPFSKSEDVALNLTLKAWWNAPGSGGIDKNIVRIDLWHDNHNQAQSVCKVRIGGSDTYINQSYYCPSSNMPDQHAAVVTAPGGTIDALGKLDFLWETLPDPVVGSFAGRNLKFKFSTTAQASPVTSFVPSLSALDIPAGGWGVSVNSRTHMTPFDAIYGNGSRNVAHNVVSASIAGSLVSEFDRAIVLRETTRAAAYAAVF